MSAAQYKAGAKLVLAAPAHTGLPAGGNVQVRAVRFDSATTTWLYDTVLLIGQTGVKVMDGVPEGWLRPADRIATAKTCAPMLFGALVRLAPRILVPVYQRRYCWEQVQWRKLWQNVIAPPSSMVPHAIGRVTVSRERHAVVIIDGQQRMTTLMLMLCALRDESRAMVGEALAAPLVAKVSVVLTSRSGKLQRRQPSPSAAVGSTASVSERAPDDSHSRQAGIGLEGLDGAMSVRLVPSQEDRLPFCSLVLGVPFERHGSRAAATMTACYDFFRTEVRALTGRQLPSMDDAPTEGIGDARAKAGGQGGGRFASPVTRPAPAECVTLLMNVVENVLCRLSLVVFELQDGVSLQNMYDMLAQRERALSAFFAHVGGKAMSEVDLVRNLLLNHIADDDERMRAYETSWLPMERAHGDGRAELLEAFLSKFVDVASMAPPADESVLEPMGPPPPPPAHTKGSGAAPTSLLERIAALLRARGGSAGAASLYAHGTASGSDASPLEMAESRGLTASGKDASRVAIALLHEMSASF